MRYNRKGDHEYHDHEHRAGTSGGYSGRISGRETRMKNHVCPWWLAYTFDNPFRYLFHKPERIFSLHVRGGMTVADIGCGMGFFSLGLARIVGNKGKVIAVDLQEKMLERVEKRTGKAGLSGIIETRLCGEDDIRISEPLDFALAFWMVHETPDAGQFFSQVFSALKPSGLLLMTEPAFHVSRSQFKNELDMAVEAGFHVKDYPKITFSSSVLLEK